MKYTDTKQCKECGETFTRPDSYTNNNVWQKKQFCSRKCRGANDRKSVERQCQECGKTMLVMPCQLGGGKKKKYCSYSCRSMARKSMVVTDETRKKLSDAQKARTDVRVGMKGEKHPNWKGGITTADRAERMKFRRLVQKQVFERDSYTCTFCETKGNLQVDHIKSWKEHPELRFDIDNCRTLCMACHYYITFKKRIPKGVVWGHNLSKAGGVS